MTFNGGLGFENSYYLATAKTAPVFPALAGDMSADVVVVGGGCTGLSVALHAAERGLSVVLLEGGRVGWGASGRNGGQIIPGLRKGADELVRRLGEARARAVAAYSNSRSGVRCAETTRTSCGMARASSISDAGRIVSQSEDDPMMIPTHTDTVVLLGSNRTL